MWPSRMRKYSVDNYDFKSRLTENQIFDRPNERTLKKKYLTMGLTDKDFIGRGFSSARIRYRR